MKKELNINKTAVAIIASNIAEIAVTVILLFIAYEDNVIKPLSNPGMVLLLIIIPTTVVFNSITVLRYRSGAINYGMQSQIMQDTLLKLEELNNKLRAQRHDFMNHLQVVYSLVEMDEFKDARDYMEKTYIDIQKINRIMKTANPAANAILQAKIIKCEKKGISVELQISSQLKDLPIPSWELCRILGNILDNSIFALEEKKEDMLLKIDLQEDIRSFTFKISDNGPQIPPELKEKIFQPGFTTKGEKGEGMGLAISREILDEYGGSISVQYLDGMTSFVVNIPRKP